MLEAIGVPAFEDNYIWLVGTPGNRHVAAVDPGDAQPVLDHLQVAGLSLEAILITHHHRDHTAGIASLREHFAVPVFGPAREQITHVDHPVGENDAVELPLSGVQLTVLDTPGHTRGHIAYFGPGVLFCGDTLFSGGCGRLFEGTPQQMFTSLEKLRALPDDTRVYCAHEYTLANLRFARIVEPDNDALRQRELEVQALRAQGRPTLPSTMDIEKRTNPFLRARVDSVRDAACRFAGKDLEDFAGVFATLRHWKDTLD